MKRLFTTLLVCLPLLAATAQTEARLDSVQAEIKRLEAELEDLQSDPRSPDTDNKPQWRKGEQAVELSLGSRTPMGISEFNGIAPNEWTGEIFGTPKYFTPYIYCPTITASYHYRFLSWFWLGANLLYFGEGQSVREYGTDNLAYRSRINSVQAQVSCRFSYFNRTHCRLYAGAAIGASVMTESFVHPDPENQASITKHTTGILPSFNLTLFGVQFGGSKIYGLAEINWSTFDICKIGLGYKF